MATPSMDYKTTFYRLWELACSDDPQRRPSCQVVDGHFVLTITGNRDKWVDMVAACGVPSIAEQTITGDVLTCRWPSHADAIFGPAGMLAQRLPNYEMRIPQLHMARLVQRAIEMDAPAVIEAGTGTGKSYAYAAICMAMDLTVVISTSNKALQMQLANKDIPFLQTIFPGKTLAVAVGKHNYACRLKVEGAERQRCYLADPALQAWYATTATGNTEEIPLALTPEALRAMTLDDDCAGRHCPLYADCFYYNAKAERHAADVVICNHKLLALHHAYPYAKLLPDAAVTVVDEAHKLPDIVRDTIGVELAQTAIAHHLRKVDDIDLTVLGAAKAADLAFAQELGQFLTDQTGPQVAVDGTTFAAGQELARKLHAVAVEVFDPGDFAMDATEHRRQQQALRLTTLARKVSAISTPNGLVRWLEPSRRDEPLTMCAKPHNVADFIAALTSDTVVTSVTDLDTYTDGDENTDETPTVTNVSHPTIFCSATLAAPDMGAFMRECGLADALQLVASSPFDFKRNALLYVPTAGAPAPNEPGWIEWLTDELRTLVLAAKGGAFLLFTSYGALDKALQALRPTFVVRGLTVLVQGELPKLELARRFAADGNAVLFATKSFFEGVDIQGTALRLVVIDKLPFEAPTPLGQAMEAASKASGRDPFQALRVPKMIIELKQGAGRLIRTQTDMGVIAIMDSRLRSHQYGRKLVLPALPDAPLTGKLAAVEAFFAERAPAVTFAQVAWKEIERTHAQHALQALRIEDVPELPF